MNVTFHAVTGLATGTFLASRMRDDHSEALFEKRDALILAAGFVGNILLHGLMDVAKHTYPIDTRSDLVLPLVLFAFTLVFVRKRFWLVYAISFLGSIFPDLVDLGPPLANHLFRLNLPTFELFPWHWSQFSGSVYDHSYDVLSAVNHALVLLASLALFVGCHRALGSSILRRR